MENKLITVFTPTYNRIALLLQCYESLKRQRCRDFIWLVVDDGSEDGTAELVHQWMAEENGFEIRCIRKPNGGLHTAYNTAIEALDTELAICVDSDDYLTDDAIECIADWWARHRSSDLAGIVALNRTQQQNILGQRLPDLPSIHLIDLYCRHGCRSDLKMIYRTALLKQEGPLPVFGSEKHMNPYYLFLKIDKLHPMLIMNRVVCIVNYQNDGMSANVIKHYVESARSFAELRLMMISMDSAPKWYILKNTIHLISSAFLAKQPDLIWTTPNRILSFLAYIPGAILAMAIKIVYWWEYCKRKNK